MLRRATCEAYQKADSWAVLRRTRARPRHTFTSVIEMRAAVHIYRIQSAAITWPAKPT